MNFRITSHLRRSSYGFRRQRVGAKQFSSHRAVASGLLGMMKFAVAIFFAFALSASCEEQSVNLLADPAPPGPSPDPQPDPASLEALCLRGTNLSGAEFGQVPGQYGADYIYPTFSQSGWNGASRFQSLGLNTFRLPIRWSRLQPSLYGALDPAESERLVTAMDELTGCRQTNANSSLLAAGEPLSGGQKLSPFLERDVTL